RQERNVYNTTIFIDERNMSHVVFRHHVQKPRVVGAERSGYRADKCRLALSQQFADRELEIHAGENRSPYITISDGADQVTTLIKHEGDAFCRQVNTLHDLSHGVFWRNR